MNAGLYIRVSTLNQVERESLFNQESRLRSYCEAKGYPVYKVYTDAGESGKDQKRPALQELLRDIKSGKIHAVIVTKLDRISRSLKDLLKLFELFHEHDIKFVSITQNIDSSGPFGRFMRDLLGLIAQLEREVTAERVSGDMHHRAKLGKWNGGIIPFGYTTQQRLAKESEASGMSAEEALLAASRAIPEAKKLCIDETEAQVVREIFRIYMETRSLRGTTAQLSSMGNRTRNGSIWSPTSVKRILTNPTYIGKIWYGKRRTDMETGRLRGVPRDEWIIVDGEHEALVPEGLFKEAGRVLSSRSKKPTRAFRTYLFSGLLRCGNCGSRMHGYTFTKKTNGKTYSYYKCNQNVRRGKEFCSGMTVPAGKLEDFAVKELMKLSENQKILNDKEKMLKILKEEHKKATTGSSHELKRLVAAEKGLQARLDKLLEKLETGLIDDNDFSRRYQSIKTALTDNRVMHERLEEDSGYPETAIEELNASYEEIADFGSGWEFLDDEGKKMKIQIIVKEIIVNKEKIELKVFSDVEDVLRTDKGSSQR